MDNNKENALEKRRRALEEQHFEDESRRSIEQLLEKRAGESPVSANQADVTGAPSQSPGLLQRLLSWFSGS